MLKSVLNKAGDVKFYGTCQGARGIKYLALIDGVHISTLVELTALTNDLDKVIAF